MSEKRMTDAERAEYEHLRTQGYALLREAHELWMTAYSRTQPTSEQE